MGNLLLQGKKEPSLFPIFFPSICQKALRRPLILSSLPITTSFKKMHCYYLPIISACRNTLLTNAIFTLPIPSSISSSSPPLRRLHSPPHQAAMNQAPQPGQESVWDYPRPPRVEPEQQRIRVVFNGETIVDTCRALRVLETSHPPVYYIPQVDIRMDCLQRAPGSSYCEWKGTASYWTVSVNQKVAPKVAWSYDNPTSSFVSIKEYIAFYCSPMDACFVGEEKAQPQPGNVYGGWITSNVVGPFKGGQGTWGW